MSRSGTFSRVERIYGSLLMASFFLFTLLALLGWIVIQTLTSTLCKLKSFSGESVKKSFTERPVSASLFLVGASALSMAWFL